MIIQILARILPFLGNFPGLLQLSLVFFLFLIKPFWVVVQLLSRVLLFATPLFSFPSFFPNIRVFSSESALCIRWPEYWSFSFIISPSNEYPRLITFRIDWFDLLAVQGTLGSLFQHHNSKATVLQHSAFFMD